MTLHWWMHWFWVTAQLAVIIASPIPSTTESPREPAIPLNATQNLTIEVPSTTPDPLVVIDRAGETEQPREQEQEVSTRASFRVAKAIGSYDPPARANVASASRSPQETPLIGVFGGSTARPNWSGDVARTRNTVTRREGPNVTGDAILPAVKRDSRITWVLTTGRPPTVRRRTEEETITEEDIIRNYSSVGQEEKDLTVLPLRVEATRFKLVVNRTRTITANGADGFSTRTFNGSEDIEIDQELAEPRLAATAASILQAGISDSTRLSRAQNAFTRDFQRDQEEDRSSEIDVSDGLLEGEAASAEIESSTPSAVDIAAITGSCLATVVLLSTMASLGFVMYRRKYLNPPQTLNSDKCSNPDSSGYIDDSTIRDNSEEMYSLDNDSFLNSLEAMTIQNYWTDSVKHTKL